MCESESDTCRGISGETLEYTIFSNCEKCSNRDQSIDKNICKFKGRSRLQGYMCNVISTYSLMRFCGYLCVLFLLEYGLFTMAYAQGNVWIH